MGKRNPTSTVSRNFLPRGGAVTFIAFLGLSLGVPQALAADLPRIEVSDILEITVKNESDLSLDRQVESGGSFLYPLLGTVEAAGKTASELAEHMEKRLYDEEFLWHPEVTVKIKERPGHVIRVIGQVKTPGQTGFEQGVRLREAIEKHGGILEANSGPDIVLRGRKRPEPVQIDRHLLFSKGPAADLLNLELRPGDEIYVEPAQDFFIVGIAEKPQPHLLTHHYTLSQVFSESVLSRIEGGALLVLRHSSTQETEIIVDLHELTDGNKALDLAISAGDRIYVVQESYFYVGGDVERPGLYSSKDDMTLGRALEAAGLPPSSLRRPVSLRRWKNGERTEYSPSDSQKDFPRDLPISDRDIILVAEG